MENVAQIDVAKLSSWREVVTSVAARKGDLQLLNINRPEAQEAWEILLAAGYRIEDITYHESELRMEVFFGRGG